MSDLDAYLDKEIARARGALLVTAIVCSVIALGVFVVARKSVELAGKRLSSEAIVSQVGEIADREIASREGDIDAHLRTMIPQLILSGPQQVIVAADSYPQMLESRVGEALAAGPDAKKRLDAVFAPITITRDRLQKLAGNGKDLLPFQRLTRRSIAVLLRGQAIR